MTTVRIKDLSTDTPTATGVVAAFDSAGGGTRKATIKELVRVGLEALGLGLSHAAAANPTVSDDSGDGYAVGSIWLNTSTGGLYVCTDPTLGAAVWTSAGASKAYVDQVAARTVSGTTDTMVADDIGGVVMYSQAGGVTVSLPSLASSLTAGRAMVLTLQATDAATVITVDPGTSVTIDGSTSNYVAPTGKARVSLISVDGLAWYSGTP